MKTSEQIRTGPQGVRWLNWTLLLVLAAEVAVGTFQGRRMADLVRERDRRRALSETVSQARRLQALSNQAQAGEEGRAPAGEPLLSRALRNPDFSRAFAVLQKQAIGERYRLLFRSLGLDPATQARFVDLLAAKQMAKTDAEGALRDAGLASGEMEAVAVAEAQKGIDDQILKLLGAQDFQSYRDFEMTSGLRGTLQRLQAALQYSSEPLSDAQVEAAVRALDQATPPPMRGGFTGFTGTTAEVAVGLSNPRFSAPLPANSPDLLAASFSPAQIAALRSLMAQQKQELRMRAAVLQGMRAAASGD